MTDTKLYERVRAADPAAEIDRDPESRSAQRVLRRARQEDATPLNHDRFSRKRLIALTAASLIVLTSGIAIAAGVFRFQPDPDDVSTILDEYADAADVHLKGWRPELSTEGVWCLYRDGRGADTSASEYPLDEPLTKQRLVDECATGNDMVRGRERPSAFTLCEGLVPAGYIDFVFEETGDRIVEGSLEGDRYRFPVVLAWDTECVGSSAGTRPSVDLRELTSLDAVNEAREVEISVRAAARQRCLTLEDAWAMAGEARSRLRQDWLIVDSPDSPKCHEVTFSHWGLLIVR